MRILTAIFFCLIAIPSLAQNKPAFDGRAWNPPYELQMEGWGIERFLIPIDFAPEIKYKGVEDIRFTRGWGDVKSPEYWSYAFLWLLDGSPPVTVQTLQKNLNLYYDGLIGRNVTKRNIPANMVTKTITRLKVWKTASGDLKTYGGTVSMLDYMAQKPMVLNAVIHVRKCPGLPKTIIFHQLSPKPEGDPVWVRLRGLWTAFK